ncbi:MAG: hypothetical protein KIT09_20700 [Bryobacteraceae bacterium]|nr:hypothetical protein [Bryobacteraceae bacterium]
MRATGIRRVLLFTFLAGPLAAQPALQCTASAGATPTVRAEGLSELVGGIEINCTGGIPTPVGQPVPTVNVFLRGNAPVGNPIYPDGHNDSFLVIGQPDPGSQALHDVLQSLSLTGVGGSGLNYDMPASMDNMGQRVPNVFQGRQDGRNSISWLGIPFDPPGTVATRIMRITNVRANASLLAQSGINSVQANLTIPELGVNAQPTLANIQPGLQRLGSGAAPYTQVLNAGVFANNIDVNPGLPAMTPLPQPNFVIQIAEGYADAWKTRTSAQGNLTNPFPAPADHSGLEARPSSETLYYNPSLPGGVGLAGHGTRVAISFGGVPPGVQVFLSNNSVMSSSSPSVIAVAVENCFDPARRADSVNGLVEVPLTNGVGSVCVEIARQDGNVREFAGFNGYLKYAGAANPVAPALILTSIAVAPGSLYPPSFTTSTPFIPRFSPTADPVAAYGGIYGAARIRSADVATNVFQSLRSSAFSSGAFTGFQGSGVIPSTNIIVATAGDSVMTTVTPVLRGGPNAGREATAGWLTVTQSQSTTPLTLNIRADPAGLAPGTYEAGIRLQAPSTAPAAAEIPIRLVVPGPGPRFAANGVAGAADYSTGAVAPGQAIVAYGAGYGPPEIAGARLDEAGRVATTLAQTRVLFDDAAAPLLYAVNGQVSAMVPFGLTPGGVTRMEIEYQGVRSPPVFLRVLAAAPGLLTADSSGVGQGAALNQDGSFNSTSNPAAPGDIVVMFGSGGGQTDPPGVDGRIAGPPLPALTQEAQVFIDGEEAEIVYVGPAPDLVEGVFQVNARIPANTRRGRNADAEVIVGGFRSQPGVTIAIAP